MTMHKASDPRDDIDSFRVQRKGERRQRTALKNVSMYLYEDLKTKSKRDKMTNDSEQKEHWKLKTKQSNNN